MVLGRKCSSMKIRRAASLNGEEVKFVRCTGSFGRKRILIPKNEEDSFCVDSPSSPKTPLKRLCSGKFFLDEQPDESSLESLPQDILIRILCGVDHDDLKRLFQVSKPIKEAAVIAKKCHFAYSTPRKTRAFQTPVDFQNPSEIDDVEAPNAPKHLRFYKSRLNGKNIGGIQVALFASPKKELFMETEE